MTLSARQIARAAARSLRLLTLCAFAGNLPIGDAAAASDQPVFKGSIINDSVTAFSGSSVKWQFITGGPVRYTPVAWDRKVYAGSDDGCVYCLDAATGKEIWKYFAGPANRKMIGNERMISAWHISGGPVVEKGRVYFAAGTWPMLGIFVCCLDAKTGELIWVNDRTDFDWRQDTYRRHPTDQEADDDDGSEDGDKSARNRRGVNTTRTPDGYIRVAPYSLNPKGQCYIKNNRLLIPCGQTLTPSFDLETGELLTILDIHPPRNTQREKILEVKDPASGKSAFLRDARIGRNKAANWEYKADRTPAAKFASDPAMSEILKRTGISNGYALVLGIGDGKYIEGLLADSSLRLVVIDPDAGKVGALRRKMDAAGYYGLRVTALADDPMSAGLPPYFASLIIVGDPAVVGQNPDFSINVLPALRPYGGLACLSVKTTDDQALSAQAKRAGLDNAEVTMAGGFVQVRRVGALTGAGSWSHQKGNAGNVFSTRDELVKAPLGVLWFGGAAGDPDIIYPADKSGRGIWPLLVGGRIILEYPKRLSAVDVYTGRLLWQWTCPDDEPWFLPIDFVGRKSVPPGMFNMNKYVAHYGVPGMVGRMAASEDAVYVVSGRKLYALDAATGTALPEFMLNDEDRWGPPVILGGQLILSSETRVLALDRRTGKIKWSFKEFGGTLAAGTGKIFCRKGLNTDVFAIIEASRRKPAVQGDVKTKPAQVVALAADSGNILWKKETSLGPKTVFVYSAEQDLLFADAAYKGSTGDKLDSFSGRINQYTAVLKDRYLPFDQVAGWGPVRSLAIGLPVTYPDPITGQPAVDVVSRGSHYSAGCGPAVAGETIVASRIISGTYYDLTLHSGVCSLNSFRSSCTAPIVPADGVYAALNLNTCLCMQPLYTSVAFVHMPAADMWTYFPRTDPMLPVPEKGNPVELWTNYPAGDPLRAEMPIRRVGLNFGAPGDRMTENGTLWLDYPMVGGPSPAIQVVAEPSAPQWFRYHQSRVKEGTGIPWVCSSGAKGLQSVTIQVNCDESYRILEYYAQPIAGDDLKLRSSVIEHRGVKAADKRLRWEFRGKGYVCGLEIVAE